jgi:tetratricopeptide (TPR) repeat protein
MAKPLCFVLMPFGKKPDAGGGVVDFDSVYRELIAPAIAEAGMEPLRADEEMTGGIIHKPMFERLILCEYAVADLTTANANVFYELGLRHAVRPWSTVLIFSKGGSQLPFDVAPLRALPYQLGPDGAPSDVEESKSALAQRLAGARQLASDKPSPDSPIYQLVEDYPNVAHEKTDVFREQVRYSAEKKEKLANARGLGIEAVRAMEKELEPIGDQESGVVIDLFLSYRSVKGWQEMVDLAQKMPRPLAKTVMVREQLALALNRLGRSEEAERGITELLEERGPSSETYGILGRVYKDRWENALKGNKSATARGLLEKAIAAYLKGFEADWRDAYPGVNAVTLMELKEPPDPRREKLIPVVAYSVERRIAAGKPDYWDYATQLELAVIAKDEQIALDALSNALASVREKWEPETTLRNLRLISEARERRHETVPEWLKDVESELGKAAAT